MSRRLEKLDPQRQKRLFENAAEEFAVNGYEGASLNRILEKSGMGKSSLYYYFDDKADLFTTLVERSMKILFKGIGGFDPAALTADDYWSSFEEMYASAIEVTRRNAWLVSIGSMFYRLRSQPKEGATTNRLFLAARRWIGVIVERGQVLGVVRTDLPNSLLIDSTAGLLESLDRWVVAHWGELDDARKQNLPAEHVGLFRRLLEKPIS
jgi:AcrR family transcriptional regulator